MLIHTVWSATLLLVLYIVADLESFVRGGPEWGPTLTTFYLIDEERIQIPFIIKYRQIKKFIALSPSDVISIVLINVKIPTIVGILTFMSRINFVIS